MERFEVCQMAIDAIGGRNYLEIGVNAGETFHAVRAEKKIAVDPQFLFDVRKASIEHQNCEYYQVTSDEYFSRAEDHKYDVIYLDGLHTFEQTLRDLLNAILKIDDKGIIIIDDVLPVSYAASLKTMDGAHIVKMQTGDKDTSWMGDVYRLVWFVDTFIQQFTYRTVSENHGQLVMWKKIRSNDDIVHRLVEDISRLSFEDMVRERSVFRLETMENIVKMIRSR